MWIRLHLLAIVHLATRVVAQDEFSAWGMAYALCGWVENFQEAFGNGTRYNNTGTNAPATCQYQCNVLNGAIAAALRGDICYCSPTVLNNDGIRIVKFPVETDCNIPCAANPAAACGGGSGSELYYNLYRYNNLNNCDFYILRLLIEHQILVEHIFLGFFVYHDLVLRSFKHFVFFQPNLVFKLNNIIIIPMDMVPFYSGLIFPYAVNFNRSDGLSSRVHLKYDIKKSCFIYCGYNDWSANYGIPFG
ncbi:uncharacterized protein CTRU02_210094 [Colletotrichum truncatum]|uniref:Uncharacterized protein n=1 Tax=Colletotrichum truncatum TaxID=5467 RepID=A0ACC3YUA6_COLTU|nr:uncharacterized protein CTRU02_02670 [Colletotrichum truncatum]KAF6798696.1 hypothetical protein CTRU02_02670 [Colletotrichum truncatum]